MVRKQAVPRRKRVAKSRRPSTKREQATGLKHVPTFERAAKAFFGRLLEAAEEDPEGFMSTVKGTVAKADAAYRYLEANPEAKRELRNRAVSVVAKVLRRKLTEA